MPQSPTGRNSTEIQTQIAYKRLGRHTGFAILGSGQVSVVASTNLVRSGSHIQYGIQAASFGAIASNQGFIAVTSINAGVGIVFGPITAVAFPWDNVIHWTISETKA